MSFILSRWAAYLAGIATILVWQSLIKGRIVNLWIALGVIADVLLDISCQVWIDISRVWKGKKAIELDDHENHIS